MVVVGYHFRVTGEARARKITPPLGKPCAAGSLDGCRYRGRRHKPHLAREMRAVA